MTAGKLASQTGHAFLDTYDQCRKEYPDRAEQYRDGSMGTKVVLGPRNEKEILRASEQEKFAGIPCPLTFDSEHFRPPLFNGQPIITALGMGPATRNEIHS